mmetsp:Transcript_70776/g.160771  ORF Transcript_70776/g.160771 Transcript_70776/m.160771 type:complete len:200 (+) Transcript_70776:713-1312(+)
MKGGVGIVFKLPGQVPAVLLRQFLGLEHHACAAQGRGRDNDLGTEHAHDLAALHREGGGHGGDKVVAALRADHGQRDACVAARGLNDGAARLQLAAALRVVDDGQRQAVFDGTKRVKELALHVQVHPCRGQAVHLDHGRPANSLGDVLIDGTPRRGARQGPASPGAHAGQEGAVCRGEHRAEGCAVGLWEVGVPATAIA